MYFQCNFMEKGCVGLFLGACLCLMTLACWCTTSWLHSSAHFHTWLTLSTSVWVARLLKALRPSSVGTLVDLLQQSCCSRTTTEQTFGRRFCLHVSILSCGTWGIRFFSFLQSYFQGRSLWSHSGCVLTECHQKSSNYSFDLYRPFAPSLTAAIRWLPWAPGSVALTRMRLLV